MALRRNEFLKNSKIYRKMQFSNQRVMDDLLRAADEGHLNLRYPYVNYIFFSFSCTLL